VETTTQIPDDIVPHMVFLGRIVPQKGLQVLLDALTQVNTPVHLDIAGDGHRLDAMRHHARDIGVGERVTFHGWVEPDEAADLIAAARAVVFPSIWHEPAGLVTLESAAHARPVIASRVGGIPEYAHPDFALRVEPGDAAALARSVNRLATDLSLARTMGAAGRRHAQTTFAMNPYLDRIDTIYEEVLHPTSLPATTI
jgi:glycosyltransferase involved in cell wall biosynthesis